MTSAALLEQHRPALTGHCYRMLGSVMDAEDAVQDTMLRAVKGVDRFREQAALKTWLHRIATNVCLDALTASRRRRVRPAGLGPALTRPPHESRVEPTPDALALPDETTRDPAERAVLRESIRLAFVAALQHLPPRPRVVLILTQVLGHSAPETAAYLGMSVAAVNSALQRARATLAARGPTVTPRGLSAEQTALVARYVAAFEAYDVVALLALLRADATMSRSPHDRWRHGPDAIAA